MARVCRRGSRFSKLSVTKASGTDADSYKCRASNAAGSVDSKSVHVAIGNKPDVKPSSKFDFEITLPNTRDHIVILFVIQLLHSYVLVITKFDNIKRL